MVCYGAVSVLSVPGAFFKVADASVLGLMSPDISWMTCWYAYGLQSAVLDVMQNRDCSQQESRSTTLCKLMQ